MRETQFQMSDEIVPNLPLYTALEENWLLTNLNAVRGRRGFDPLLSLEVDEGFELEDISNDSWRSPNCRGDLIPPVGPKVFPYLLSVERQPATQSGGESTDPGSEE